MSGPFKDLFSVQAEDYAKFRPGYSPDIFKYLGSLTESHDLAWDVGTGNGQAAIEVARYYKKVVASDPSEKQLSMALQSSNISYCLAMAENAPLPDYSVDLITVAQAFHWFNQEKFFAEVARVAKPNSILAIWCYGMAQISPAVDAKVFELYNGVLGSYWEKERKLVEEGYCNENIPFEEIIPPAFQLHAEWSLNHLIGYLSTWSALQKYIKEKNSNPLEDFYPELRAIWGADDQKKITWNLSMRVARIK